MMYFSERTAEQKEAITAYLREFVTPHKQRLIDETLQLRTRHITVVLEDIFQPHNASAVLRSAECFGLQDVHIIENENEYQLNKDVTRGAAKWLTLHRYQDGEVGQGRNTRPCLESLKAQGYTIAAATLRPGSVSVRDVDITQKLALCFGTEEEGLSDEAHELADMFVQVPMVGFTQSFNISVSAALCLYELTNRLRQSEVAWQLSEEERRDILALWMMQGTKNGRAIVHRYYLDHGWPIPPELAWEEVMPDRLKAEQLKQS